MTKNIKEIGKELLGKSLNSFHRKTGLTQLEENNKMQDGILNGILSQVDDAYIEKTEQSNVIHLDGSGDGVVVVDSIEGNTMVNLTNLKKSTEIVNGWYGKHSALCEVSKLKYGEKYTLIFNHKYNSGNKDVYKGLELGLGSTSSSMHVLLNNNSTKFLTNGLNIHCFTFSINGGLTENEKHLTIRPCRRYDAPVEGESVDYTQENYMLLEGDWTDKEIPPYFEGLQSSFEEKINDEGKYEIEILNNNKNLLDVAYLENLDNYIKNNRAYLSIPIKLKPNTTYTMSMSKIGTPSKQLVLNIGYDIWDAPQNAYILANIFNITSIHDRPISVTFRTNNQSIYYLQYFENGHYTSNADMSQWFTRMCENLILEEGSSKSDYVPNKHNKIKLLINEPLRAIGDIKDKLCVKDGKLMIERNLSSTILKDIDSFVLNASGSTPSILYCKFILNNKIVSNNGKEVQPIICNKYATVSYDRRFETDTEGIYDVAHNNSVYVKLLKSKVSSTTDINVLNEYFKNNPTYVVYKSATTYEEVLNEYGEPILLEGYENGTLYIDSTIIPTTSVRYTPKMESFNTLKEVSNNNIMLTNDINNTIVPYMMEVDLMIMEKEVALMSQKNIRKIGAEDMTSMQKRTQQMLERLIKGKSLTEQECKTRVTTYLNANKITDEQADELMLLISEVYA